VPEGSRDHLNLPDLVRLASEAGGDRHHFRFIQLPFNLAMPEAYALHNQNSGGAKMSVLSAAHELGVAVVSSATLYQGQLAHGLPRFVGQVLGLKNDAENAIQFSRSAPGMATSLVGMGHKEHVAANLKTALVPRASLEAWIQLFSAE
jgi:predicted aldo/keto reductase-like oxidoreductase